MKKIGLFSDKLFYRDLFALAIPIMLQNLVNSFVNMVDTVMIGRLGDVEIAAVGLGNQFFFFYSMILIGTCSGAAIFTAQFWGKRDIPGIRANMGLCLSVSLAAGFIFTLLVFFFPENIISIYSRDPAVIATGTAYIKMLVPGFIPYAVSIVFVFTLRSIEKVRLAMTATVIALSVNMALNYVFIFGLGPVPAMGVRGAALATVIARILEMLILVLASYARRYVFAGSIRELLGFRLPFVERFLRIAAPVTVNEMAWSFGIVVQNIIFARTHTDAIVAFQITNTLSQLTWVIFIGLGQGSGVLIGKRIGAGDEKTARDYAARIAIFSPLISLGVALLLAPVSKLLPFIFNVSPTVLSYATMMILILSCSYPLRACNMAVMIGVCRAGGDTIFCIMYDLLFMWAFSLPLAAAGAFIFHVPVWLIYLLVNSEEPLKLMLGLWRLRSGKWLHNVTG